MEWRYTEEGDKVRVSKRTGRIVPLPAGYHECEDGVIPGNYIRKCLRPIRKSIKKSSYVVLAKNVQLVSLIQ